MSRTWIVVLCAVLLVSCARGDDGDEASPEPVEVPAGFVVPEGIELSEVGEPLAVGEAATVILAVDDRTNSVVTVVPEQVDRGDLEDFADFRLEGDLASATPYYVTVRVENLGPAGIGGAALPLYIDAGVDGTVFPPTDIIGHLPACTERSLPESLLPDESAELCLVYLVPEDSAPQGFEFITASDDRILWDYTPPTEDAEDEDA